MAFDDLDLDQLAAKIASKLRKCESDEEPEGEKDEDEDKKENEYSAPSGANTAPPTEVEEKEEKRMQSETLAIKFSHLESHVNQLQRENDALKLQLRRTIRERDLKQLQAEGYTFFDLADELTLVESMEDKTYAKHLSRARSLYKRSPAGQEFVPTSQAASGDAEKSEVDAVVQFGSKHGIYNYELARTKYKESLIHNKESR